MNEHVILKEYIQDEIKQNLILIFMNLEYPIKKSFWSIFECNNTPTSQLVFTEKGYREKYMYKNSLILYRFLSLNEEFDV